ncbi:MAG: esterase-like activity of phytase family protein [Alphaproteobacteria bacterium]
MQIRFRFVLVPLAMLVLSCQPRAQPVTLNDRDPAQQTVGGLSYRGGVVLDFDDDSFGGLSALDVSGDGKKAIALSDAGNWFELRLDYDSRGWLEAVQRGPSGRLQGRNGRVARRKSDADAESMVRLADGSIIVGFEINHRLLHYPAADPAFSTAPSALTRPPGIRRAPGNNGMEAITLLADGRLLVIAEDGGFGDTTLAWIGDGTNWTSVGYVLTPPYLPTGAALLPDGDVVVVERRASLLRGFGARLVRLSAEDIAAGGRLRGREIARLDSPLTVDNLEGIATRVGADGETLIYLISDDNFSLFQRTLLLVFALDE